MVGRVASRFSTCTAVPLHSVKRDNCFFFSETTLLRDDLFLAKQLCNDVNMHQKSNDFAGLEKPRFQACSLGKQLSKFTCPGPLLACLS